VTFSPYLWALSAPPPEVTTREPPTGAPWSASFQAMRRATDFIAASGRAAVMKPPMQEIPVENELYPCAWAPMTALSIPP